MSKGRCASKAGLAWPVVKWLGDWAGGMMQGTGTLYHPEGWMYAGEWKEGRMEGRGEISPQPAQAK